MMDRKGIGFFIGQLSRAGLARANGGRDRVFALGVWAFRQVDYLVIRQLAGSFDQMW